MTQPAARRPPASQTTASQTTASQTTASQTPASPTPGAAPRPGPAGVADRAAELSLFVRSFLRDPLRTASVVPSSRLLAERLLRPLSPTGAEGRRPVVVELGPGTGVITRALLGTGAPVDYLGLELNEAMIAHLRRRFAGIDVVQAPASRLREVVETRGLAGVDLVVSGLPWQAWAGGAGRDLVGAVADVLAPGGAFTQFTYSWTLWAPPARRQRRDLEAGFALVDRSSVVWRNFPPAVVYTATGPRTTTQT